MEVRGVEYVVWGTKMYIEVVNAAKIAAVAARDWPAGPVAMTPFKSVKIGDPRAPGSAADLPILYIIADLGQGDRWTSRALDGGYQVEFAILARGASEEEAKLRLWRYMAAVVEMLQDMHSTDHDTDAGGLHWGTGGIGPPLQTFYMPTYTLGSNVLVSDGRIVTSVRYVEPRS